MAILNLFLDLASSLQAMPEKAVSNELDELFAESPEFAYIGNRKGLEQLGVDWMSQVRDKLVELTTEEQQLLSRYPELNTAVRRIQSRLATPSSPEELLQVFLGANWQRNSGAYPDFILASRNENLVGDGAILELKDSKAGQIASFNSTIPTRFKSLSEVQRVTKSKLPIVSASLYDLPRSLEPTYTTQQRTCFYFVRTHSKSPNLVKLSLIEGSFFETVPKGQLLREIWSQILDSAGLDDLQRESLVEPLSHLEQGDIAKSRSIENASIKPRFRIMAEAHSEGNPHNYPAIEPRNVNLILKLPDPDIGRWVKQQFTQIGLRPTLRRKQNYVELEIEYKEHTLLFKVFTIQHKRNGEHLVIQYKLPDLSKTSSQQHTKQTRRLRESSTLFEIN